MDIQEGTDPSNPVAVEPAVTDIIAVHNATDGRDSAVDDATMETNQAYKISADMTAPKKRKRKASSRKQNENVDDGLSSTQMQPPPLPNRRPSLSRNAKNKDAHKASGTSASDTGDAFTIDNTQQAQQAPSRKGGQAQPREMENENPQQDLTSEGDSTGKVELPANVKRSVFTPTGTRKLAELDYLPGAYKKYRLRRSRQILPCATSSRHNLRSRGQASSPGNENYPSASTPSQLEPSSPDGSSTSPGAQGSSPQGLHTQDLASPAQTDNTGDNQPGSPFRDPSPQGPNNSGGHLPSQPQAGQHPMGSSTAPGVLAGSPGGSHAQDPARSRAHNTGSRPALQLPQGSFADPDTPSSLNFQGPPHPGRFPPSSYATPGTPSSLNCQGPPHSVRFSTSSFAAPGTPRGKNIQGLHPTGSHLKKTFYTQGPPPSAPNMLPQDSPQTGASGSSSEPSNPSVSPTQQNTNKAYFVVPDGVDPIAIAARFLPTDDSDLPVITPAMALETAPDQAAPRPQPASDRDDATDDIGPDDGPAPAGDPAQDQGDETTRQVRLPMAIRRLGGLTMYIVTPGTLPRTWPQLRSNKRGAYFISEVMEANTRIYNVNSVLSPEEVLMFRSEPTTLASSLWPDADSHKLRLAIDVSIWSISLDIFLKKTARNDPSKLKARVDDSKRVMRDAVEDLSGPPREVYGRWTRGCTDSLNYVGLEANIRRIVQSLRAFYNPDQLDIFKEDFCDYMDAIAKEQELLDVGHIRHEDYAEFLAKPAHVPPMLRIAMLDTYGKDRDSRCVLYETLVCQAHRIMRFSSDLFSVREDVEMGNVLNSFILRHDEDNSPQLAVAKVVCDISLTCQMFDQKAAQKLLAARAAGELEEAECRVKIDFLRHMCVGHFDWCMKNQRYNMKKFYQEDNKCFAVPLPHVGSRG